MSWLGANNLANNRGKDVEMPDRRSTT